MNENKKKSVIIFVRILLPIFGFLLGCTYGCHRISEKKTEPKVMDKSLTTDSNAISKTLKVDNGTAKEITREIYHVQSGEAQPSVTYYVSAPDVKSGAEKVSEDIKNGNPAVPKEAIEKSDRTVVTPDEEKQKVDVYKINLNKKHKIKAGIMTTGDKTYYGAGYQQGKWEGMIYTRSGKKVEAGSVTYTVYEW